jgi:hypothetical protein
MRELLFYLVVAALLLYVVHGWYRVWQQVRSSRLEHSLPAANRRSGRLAS